jgi:hypothetical protein
MSGVFSIVSQVVLQYLPVVVSQVQMGCAHFSVFAGVISLLLTWDQDVDDASSDTSHREKIFLYTKETHREIGG